jgi:hypothetical protein
MLASNSRYAALAPTTATTASGQTVVALPPRLPPAAPPALAGYYRRPAGERLDLVAARFLADPTAFWRLCDANNCMVPDALAARPTIGIPA